MTLRSSGIGLGHLVVENAYMERHVPSSECIHLAYLVIEHSHIEPHEPFLERIHAALAASMKCLLCILKSMAYSTTCEHS